MHRMTQFMSNNGFDFFFVQQLKDTAGQDDARVIFGMTVGESVRSSVIDKADARQLHVVLCADISDKCIQIVRHLRVKLCLIDPSHVQICQPRTEQELQDQCDDAAYQGIDDRHIQKIEDQNQKCHQQAEQSGHG